MYWDLIKFPIEHENLKWQAREALLDIDGRPHLFVRIKLTGTRFVHRAAIPQVWVGEVFARYVLIDEDELAVRAYFDHVPPGASLYFGYERRAELSFGRFDAGRMTVLDRVRLPRGTRIDEGENGLASDALPRIVG
jgi:hypothetical protein